MTFNILIFKILFFYLIISTNGISAQKSNYKFLGCFLEENLLSFGDESRILNPISPQSCSEFCSEKQLIFYILKNNTCYCSKNYISVLMKQFDSDCTTNCIGDNSASCGGTPKFVSSYITDSLKSDNFLKHGGYPIPIYLGCYSETPNDNKNRLLKGVAKTYDNNTPQKCSEICFNMGYLYFGVTKGSECVCGNQQPSKSSKIDDTNCNSPCNADNKQFCGGQWKMGIYSTGLTDHVPRKYVGCFDTDENNSKDKYLSYNMGNNNSPKRCMNLCNTQQFKYAAVIGNVCECKNYEPNFILKRRESDCITMCKENPSENCGGGITAQNVYKTLYPDSRSNAAVKVNYIGCYNSLNQHPLLNGWKLTITRLTPKNCVHSCFARMFPYAALTSSNECLCSYVKPSKDAKTVNNVCNIPCSGSSEQSCGGKDAIVVYGTGLESSSDAIGNYYIGCYEDSRSKRVFSGSIKYFPTNTPEFCSNYCYKLGYQYSGVSQKSECFCNIQGPNTEIFSQLVDEQCNTICSGDVNQFCGGVWRTAVFSTGLEHFPTDDRYLGCFYRLQKDGYSLSDINFALPHTNRPRTCSRLCNNFEYRFAGVRGINCMCGNRMPGDENKESSYNECSYLCVGPFNETCGGYDGIQIYDLKKSINNIELSNTRESIKLNEEFDDFLNIKSLWSYDIYIPQEPDFEFVIYNNSENNVFLKDGELVIKPTILPDSYVKKGSVILKGCTKNDEPIHCAKNATSYDIIPPIVSAKITTKNIFFFRYGQLEVIAKLPTGDWIVPEIALVSKANERNKLVLATSFGNDDLKCDEIDESATVLRYGLKIDEQYHIATDMMESNLEKPWFDDYHSFVLSWTPENVVFKIDGKSNNLDAWNLPLNVILDSEYYISVGVSVGGRTNFRDGCLSNGKLKPWKNNENKAMFNFWKNKNEWKSTWNDERSTLRVKSIKFTVKENIK